MPIGRTTTVRAVATELPNAHSTTISTEDLGAPAQKIPPRWLALPKVVLAVLLGAAAASLPVIYSLAPFNDDSMVLPETSERKRALARLEERRETTFRGLEQSMLGKTGLPIDRMTLDPRGRPVAWDTKTSPTNVGLYLASIPIARDQGWMTKGEARQQLRTSLDALGSLERDELGYFFNWYDAEDGRRVLAEGDFVSAVDNGNLMIALTGLKSAFAGDKDIQRRLDAILSPMLGHFRGAFLREHDGHPAIMIGYKLESGQRVDVPNFYDRLGSEARATIALVEAEGGLPAGTFASLGERIQLDGGVFKTWDGGVFQWLLPEVLLGESEMSPAFAANHQALVDRLIIEGEDGIPAAYSASDRPNGEYDGKAGLPQLAEDAPGLIHPGIVTPHALFLIGAIAPEVASAALDQIAARYAGAEVAGRGFVDAVDLKNGAVGHTMLSLDQLMSVIAGADFGRYVRAAAPQLGEVYRSLVTLPGTSSDPPPII
jgi:hypothetical protein